MSYLHHSGVSFEEIPLISHRFMLHSFACLTHQRTDTHSCLICPLSTVQFFRLENIYRLICDLVREGQRSVSQSVSKLMSQSIPRLHRHGSPPWREWSSQSKNKSLYGKHLSPNCSTWTRRHRCCKAVKFTLAQAMEDQRRSRGIYLLFLWPRH